MYNTTGTYDQGDLIRKVTYRKGMAASDWDLAGGRPALLWFQILLAEG